MTANDHDYSHAYSVADVISDVPVLSQIQVIALYGCCVKVKKNDNLNVMEYTIEGMVNLDINVFLSWCIQIKELIEL
jgi:hypothetical protein